MSRTPPPLAVLALIAVAGLISACASRTSAENGSGVANGTAANARKAVKFAECMRHHGVSNFPDPGPTGNFTIDGIANGSSLDVNAPAFTQAITRCQNLEPAGFTGTKRTPEQMAVALKFAKCIRANGVPDFPDPTPGGPLIDTNRIPSAAGRGAHDIPGFQAAADKCGAIYGAELGLPGK